jgi:hypothetical protein
MQQSTVCHGHALRRQSQSELAHGQHTCVCASGDTAGFLTAAVAVQQPMVLVLVMVWSRRAVQAVQHCDAALGRGTWRGGLLIGVHPGEGGGRMTAYIWPALSAPNLENGGGGVGSP